MAIHFHDEDIISGLKKKRSVKSWLNTILASENKIAGQINIIFTTDKHLLEINRKYFSKDYYTDIITFDYSEGSVLNGDLFISIERVKDNAKDFGSDQHSELRRVMAHGILHLMGYGDKTDKESKTMRKMEDISLESFLEHE